MRRRIFIMGLTSRRKGQNGERELAGLLRDLTGWPVARRVRQHDGDSDLVGVPGWAVECKRRRSATRADIAGWWAQTVAQAGGQLPVLFYRVDRADWRAVWPLAVHLVEQHSDMWAGYAWTCETSIEAWAAVARELHAQSAAPVEARVPTLEGA
jgi:Holliday junction resolvase